MSFSTGQCLDLLYTWIQCLNSTINNEAIYYILHFNYTLIPGERHLHRCKPISPATRGERLVNGGTENDGNFQRNITQRKKQVIVSSENPVPRLKTQLCSLQDRSLQLAKFCQNRKISTNIPHDILVDTDNKVLFCYINKVASITIKRMFYKLKTQTKKHSYRHQTMKDGGYRYLKDFRKNNTRLKEILTTFNRGILVRHPLDRLRSAYYNKFVKIHYVKPQKYKDIIQKYRQSNTDKYKHMHFEEFIKFVLYDQPHDTHWEAYGSACNPCYIKYDYILRMETFDRDLDIFGQNLYNKSIDELLSKGEYQNTGIYSGAKNKTVNVGIKEFAAVEVKEWENLLVNYSDDMEMFGYTFDRDRSVARCGSKCC